MPDRYGEPDDPPVVDLDSRRQARDTSAAVEAARRQRERLAASREVHAPMTREQSIAARAHRSAVAEQAERRRNELRIANCTLCDSSGYRKGRVCDHVDRRQIAARGMARVRAAMGWKGQPSARTTIEPGERE